MEENIPKIPTMSDFCIQVPLYQVFPFIDSQAKEIGEIETFRGHFDCYCLECKQDSVFHSGGTTFYVNRRSGYYRDKDIDFDHTFYCTRDDSHIMIFYFRIYKNTITKTGQRPSMADIFTVETQKYRKVLSQQSYSEFNRAVGLSAHGIGIGSFVYLRRIFENLIEDAHKIAQNSDDWLEEQYQKSRMDNKIALLKGFLPPFLVDNKSLYSILSKGIHQLNEQDCLDAFPVVKLGIELILDEKIAELERIQKLKDSSSDINKLTKILKSNN